MTNHNILVPVDGSDHSRRAAEYSLKISEMMNKPILLLHCHKAFPSTLGEPYFQKAIDKILENANALLAPFRELYEDHGISYEGRILEGPPGSRICEVAQIEKSEMIVMGSRGHTDLAGLFLGSVTHRVLHASPCPVLVIR